MRQWQVKIGSLGILIILLALLAQLTRSPQLAQSTTPGPIQILAAAGTRGPMTEIAQIYAQQHGVPIDLHFGGTGSLLGQLLIHPAGDGFLAADAQQLDIAADHGLIDERLILATQRPVLAVAAGNPRGIQDLHDLLRDDVRFAIAHPEAAAIGSLTHKAFDQLNLWEAVRSSVTVMKPSVTDLTTDLRTGAVDAVIIWDHSVSLLAQAGYTTHIIDVPLFNDLTSDLSLGLLNTSQQPTQMVAFARWLASPTGGQVIFKNHGFSAPPAAP